MDILQTVVNYVLNDLGAAVFVPLLMLIIGLTARMSGTSHPRTMSACITRSVYGGCFAVRHTASLPHKIRCIA